MDDPDLARFIEDVLITLIEAKDRGGLKIVLSTDQKVAILAGAILAVTNHRSSLETLFRPLVIERFGLGPEEGGRDG